MRPLPPEIVVPKALTPDAREALVDALYRVHGEIFDGVSRASFARYVIDSPADETRILVHRDPRGEVVGYFAAHVFRRRLHGRPAIILRGEAGLLRAHRGAASNQGFGMREAARVIARNPGVPVYLLACLIHPSSYYNLTKYISPVWPSATHRPEGELLAAVCELGDSFGLKPVGDDPLVRKVGWRTRDSAAERAFWRRNEKPGVRFFLDANPDYGAGHGLLTLCPISPATVAGAAARITRERASRAAEDARARAHHAPVAARWLRGRELRRRLRALPLFQGLNDAQVEALAARADVVTVPAGRAVVREGEQGDELYVIDSGSVHVTASRRGEEVHLEQLDAGDFFGEIAALSGEARTATARAATRATLVRLRRAALLDAMERDASLAAVVRARYAERRFHVAAASQPALARMSAASRAAFLRQGTALELAAGEARALPGPGFVFVVRGDVTLEHAGARVSSPAPVLFEFVREARVEARVASSLLVLPPAPEVTAADLFREHPLLARLTDREFAALLDAASPVELAPAEVVFDAGAPADAFYLVRRGAVDIVLGGEVLARLGAGECFGERGLDPSGAGLRTAGARALGPASLLRVSAETFRAVVGVVVFGTDRAPEAPRDELAAMLGGRWAAAPPPLARVLRYPAGATLLAEGEDAHDAWYLVEGVARVTQGGRVIGQVRPGQCFGERAVLMGTTRSASVVAETDVVVNQITAADFRRWVDARPELGDLLTTLAQIHRSPDGARTTTVHRGAHDGHPCVTSVTRLPDGRSFTAVKLLDRPTLLLTSDDGRGPATGHVEFERAAPGTRRRLEHRGDRAVTVALEGDLGAAAACGERLRRGDALTGGELERFRWTGRLGAAGHGDDRLVCGCVGVTRGDLAALQAAGVRGVDGVTERVGAGSVCGGCVPLMRRLVEGSPEGLSARHPDEVDLDAFEARLDGLRHVDAARSLCGPETVTWRVYGETAALLGGLRALLLQFAHPLSQALVEHSMFTVDSPGRLHRTLESVYGMAFGEGATMLRLAREVHEKHARVVGRYDRTQGDVRAGDRYAANQVGLLLWVGATVVDTSVVTHEALVGPLSVDEKNALLAEAADLLGLFGVPRARFPRDWASFRAYFDGVLASGALAVGDHARTLAAAVLRAPDPARAPLYGALRVLTARWLPEPLRAPYGLDDGPAARASAAALEGSIRALLPRLPRSIRVCPARLHAERRLRGEAGPDPDGLRLEQAIAAALGAGARGAASPGG